MNRGLHREPNNPLEFQLKAETNQKFCTMGPKNVMTHFLSDLVCLMLNV